MKKGPAKKKRPAKKKPPATKTRQAQKKPAAKRADELRNVALLLDSLEGIGVAPVGQDDSSLQFTLLRVTEEDWWTSLWIIMERLVEGVQLTIVQCTSEVMTVEMSFKRRDTVRRLLDELLKRRQEIHAE